MAPTDNELIARVLARDDRAAFGTLVERHQSSVRGFLRQLTNGNAALADDLAQDTFIRAYRGLKSYHETSAFGTWVLGIAHNLYRNAWRRQRTADNATEGLGDTDVGYSATRLSDLQHDLSLALRHLSADEQTAVHLHYHQGLSHQDIADVLECPVGTVKTHLARGKEKLRPLLSAWNPQT